MATLEDGEPIWEDDTADEIDGLGTAAFNAAAPDDDTTNVLDLKLDRVGEELAAEDALVKLELRVDDLTLEDETAEHLPKPAWQPAPQYVALAPQ
jgi:hypothetical protein